MEIKEEVLKFLEMNEKGHVLDTDQLLLTLQKKRENRKTRTIQIQNQLKGRNHKTQNTNNLKNTKEKSTKRKTDLKN